MSSTNPSRATTWVLLALAAVVVVIGVVNAAEGPTCGRSPMSPGDTCLIDGDRYTYQDQVESAERAPLVNGAIALVLVGFAVHEWRRGARGPGASARPRGRTAAAGDVEPSTTALPFARTPAEAQLAVSLTPCSCGASDVTTQNTLLVIDGVFVQHYSGDCRCGKPREFAFRLPNDPLASPPGEFRFGDGRPSQLLDPGVWLAVADRYARSVPADVTGADAATRRAARQTMVRAVAAMDEVLAFLPPGADTVPADAFSSPAGRQVRDREPGRFHRRRLEVVRDTYRQIVAEMADPAPDPRAR